MGWVPEFLAVQFRKPRCEDYPGVLIPLEQAERHHSVVSKSEQDAKDFEVGEKTDVDITHSMDKEGDPRRFSAGAYDIHTLEGLRAEIEADMTAFGHDSAYDRKSKIINKAIQDIGMGWYQWCLFVLCGFGWFADNFWLQGVAITLPQLVLEFGVSTTHARFTTLSIFTGLCLGASFWGIASDIIGRRLAFNTTLFIAAAFGLAVGGAPNWIATCALYACVGVGVGGNLPVDGALFLEFLPFASGNLLTLLSVWWPIGAFVASMIAWGLIPNYSCDPELLSCNISPAPCCTRADNWGWRYFNLTLGAITFLMWSSRFFLFHLFESPKFLLSRGRQAEAVAVVHGIAYKNGRKTWLTEEILNEIGGHPEAGHSTKLSNMEIIRRSLGKFSTERFGPLFSNWKLGVTTGLLWFQWCTIGMGYPLFNAFLPQYLSQSNSNTPNTTYTTYRNYAITTAVGVPGSLIACYTVDIKYVGRKGTMAISTLITGVFLYLFTISADEKFQIAFSSLEAFFQNVAYGVLYAYTPEVFPAPNRGTGTGVASFLNRIGGLCAPIIAVYASEANPKSPIYASGGLFLAAGLSMLLLPLETRGKQSL